MDDTPPQLYSSNTPPQAEHWFLKIQGECVEVSRHLSYSKSRPGPRRLAVADFSRHSRMRLLRTIAHIDWPRLGKSLFVTLTYPDKVGETTYEQRTKHRYLFMRYVEGHLLRHVPSFWRVEWVPRKSGARAGKVTPHFHLLLGGVEFLNHRKVRKWWRTIVHVNGPLCTDVQCVGSDSQVVAYLCKYASKNPSLDYAAYLNSVSRMGRHWGLTRKHLFPWHDISTLRELTDEQAKLARSLGAEYIDTYDQTRGGSFTILGKEGVERISEICPDGG